jgi:hypothetical protein
MNSPDRKTTRRDETAFISESFDRSVLPSPGRSISSELKKASFTFPTELGSVSPDPLKVITRSHSSSLYFSVPSLKSPTSFDPLGEHNETKSPTSPSFHLPSKHFHSHHRQLLVEPHLHRSFSSDDTPIAAAAHGLKKSDSNSPYLDVFSASHLQQLKAMNHRNTLNHFDNSSFVVSSSLSQEKRFQKWKGNNTFLLGGRVMTGSHPYQLLISFLLILVTSVTFFLIIIPFIQERFYYEIFFFLNYCNYLFLFMTAFTEPGIYPKRQYSANDIFQLKYSTILKDSYCLTCGILHSSRSKHCRYCNNCVEVFDHHCPVREIQSFFFLKHIFFSYFSFFL